MRPGEMRDVRPALGEWRELGERRDEEETEDGIRVEGVDSGDAARRQLANLGHQAIADNRAVKDLRRA